MVGAELVHAGFEIVRHQPLHRIAIHRDQLAQKVDRQHLFAAHGFFFHNDLGQDLVGDIGSGLGIEHLEIDPFAGHLGEMIERYVAG